MISAHVEYVGFHMDGANRGYTLRVRQANGESNEFTLVIHDEAFQAHRVRYQDAPEICYLKLQRALGACMDGLPAQQMSITDEDLEEYRLSHVAKPRKTSPRVPPPA